MITKTTFHLLPAEVAEIMKPVVGQGGHQTVMRALQAQLAATPNVLSLTDAQIGRVLRYAGYSQGGFQNRFKAAFRRVFHNAMN